MRPQNKLGDITETLLPRKEKISQIIQLGIINGILINYNVFIVIIL